MGGPETEGLGMSARSLDRATLAGGCFWCLEPLFAELRGVEKVVVGYTDGTTADPDYPSVCSGATGHAEAVQVTFDPARISFRDLLEVFFVMHDPTTLNRQGADVGTQYRSAVFYHSDEQRRAAEEIIRRFDAEAIWDGSIVTEVARFRSFYPAEDYHQGYFRKNPNQGYCRVVVAPKVAKFRSRFGARLQGTGG